MTTRRRPGRGTGKGINHLLLAILADGGTYRCDAEPFVWHGTCPFCRTQLGLKIRIENDDDYAQVDCTEFVEGGILIVGCSKRCHTPEQIKAYYRRPIEHISYEAEIRELTSRLRWWIEFAQRQNELLA